MDDTAAATEVVGPVKFKVGLITVALVVTIVAPKPLVPELDTDVNNGKANAAVLGASLVAKLTEVPVAGCVVPNDDVTEGTFKAKPPLPVDADTKFAPSAEFVVPLPPIMVAAGEVP